MPNVTHYAANGTATVYASLTAALDAPVTTGTLVLAPGSHSTTKTSIPVGVAMRFDPEATIALSDGQTLTINGLLDAAPDTIFTWTTSGKVLFREGSVPAVYPEWWGARGDGEDGQATANLKAIQAAIDACSETGGVVRFSAGRYRTNGTLTMKAEHSGIILQGAGRAFGATPASNYGTSIEYNVSSAEALKIGPPTTSDATPGHIVVKDLTIQATHTSYSGNLVQLLRVAWLTFENVGFLGLPAAASVTAAALVYGNEWVDVTFDRCHFEAAVTGVKKAAVSGWGDYANAVYFDNCWFKSCTTSADFPTSCQSISFDRCIVERAMPVGSPPVASASPLSIVSFGGSITRCWFGDADEAGTWVKLGGSAVAATDNFFSTGGVAIEVVAGTVAASVERNAFHGFPLAVLVKGSRNTRVAGNSFAVPADGVAVDVYNDTSALITDNFFQALGDDTTGYVLRSGTAGVLNQLRSADAADPINDLSGGAWTITTEYQTTYASAISGFNPSRFAAMQSLTDQASTVSAGRVNFQNLIGRSAVESQGYFLLSGSAGNPASSTKFVGSGGTANDVFVNAPGRIFLDILSANHALELSNTSTNDETAAVLLIRQGGSWTGKRVVQKAADSAGSGFRQLAVAN